MHCNNLMCLSVGCLFPDASHFGLLRSAGTRGAHIFEELIEADNVPVYVEIKTKASSSSDENELHLDDDDNNHATVGGGKGVDSVATINACALLGDPHNIPVQFLDSERSSWFVKAMINDGPHLAVTVSYTPMEHRGLCFNATIGPSAFNIVKYRCDWPVKAVGGHLDDDGGEAPSEMREGPHYIELCGFENVKIIYDSFISECENLVEVSLAPLAKVTTIGNDCLFWCNSLKTIDLTPLANVTFIGENFVSGCKTLTTIDVRPFSRVASIGEAFLSGCVQLQTVIVDSCTFLNMEEIPDLFVGDCPALKEFNTTSFINVRIVGCSFLYGCTSIQSIDITPFKHVSDCGSDFICHCSVHTEVVSTVPLDDLSAALQEAIADSTATLTIQLPTTV